VLRLAQLSFGENVGPEEKHVETNELLILLNGKVDALVAKETIQSNYSTKEFAERVHLSDWTVRNYCRLGRLIASKKRSGRGLYPEWTISHEELERYRRDGLL
jgi:Helix-turn-helix domain